MERKSLEWEVPGLIYLSSCESHGMAGCVTGPGVYIGTCTLFGIGAASCSEGGAVGASGIVCADGSNPAINIDPSNHI